MQNQRIERKNSLENTLTISNQEGAEENRLSTYNGRSVSYSPKTSVAMLQLPTEASSNQQADPPRYNHITDPAAHLSMDQTSSVTSVNLNNLSQENKKIRDFFFNLKESLAKSINDEDRFVPYNPTSPPRMLYNKDGCDQDFHCGYCLCKGLCCITLGFSALPFYLAPNSCQRGQRSEIPKGIKEFSTRVSLGYSFIYKDIIPLLDDESNKKLTDYFTSFFSKYYLRETIYSNIYAKLMKSLSQYDESSSYQKSDLKTLQGDSFSFKDILLMGVCTIEGGKYEATNPYNPQLFKTLNVYRWGTSDVIKLKYTDIFAFNNLKNISYQEHSYSELEEQNISKEFWQRTDSLAKAFLTQDEFQTSVQQIPATPIDPIKVYKRIHKGGEDVEIVEVSWRSFMKDNIFV